MPNYLCIHVHSASMEDGRDKAHIYTGDNIKIALLHSLSNIINYYCLISYSLVLRQR